MEFGYDVPLNADADVRLLCPICLLVLRDAHQTACGHRFCKACIKRVILNNNSVLTCPVDKTYTRVDQMFPDIATQREVLSLPIKCTNSEEGCTWQGELRDLEKHCTTCPMEEIECTYGCEVKTRREELDDHMTQCPLRQVKCPHCEIEVVHNQLESHIEECPKVRMKCDLCEQELLREDMKGHSDKNLGNCPNVVIYCPYRYVGCGHQAERSLMKDHLHGPEALEKHMKLAVEMIEEQGLFMKELRDKMTALTEKTEKMYPLLLQTDRQHSQITDELRHRNVTGKLHWKVKVGGHQRNRCTSFSSPAFYTGCPGYKVQLVLNLDGPRDGNVRYASLSIVLLAGDYDNEVVFPFNATCLVTLYDQMYNSPQQRQNQTHQIVVREVPRNMSSGNNSGRSYKRELNKYVKRQDLMGSGSRYLRHGSLHFEVTVIHSFFPPLDDPPPQDSCVPSHLTHGALVLHTPNRSRNPYGDPLPTPHASPIMRVATLAISN